MPVEWIVLISDNRPFVRLFRLILKRHTQSILRASHLLNNNNCKLGMAEPIASMALNDPEMLFSSAAAESMARGCERLLKCP